MNRQTAAHGRSRANAATTLSSGVLRRKCDCGRHTMAGGECSECARKRSALQRATSGDVPPVVRDELRSPGQPLDTATRAFMEPRFGHSFSGVRVHTDAKAAESAQAVDALAFTVGHDIVFGARQYAPGSAPGRRLLAHELTHTLQQPDTAGPGTNPLRIGAPDDAQEREAEAQAAHVAAAGAVDPARLRASSSRSLQRQPKTGGKDPKAPCPKVVATHSFSRGNDDPIECQYETAHITVKLSRDACACSETTAAMPLRLEYLALMGGKSFSDSAKTVPETQASTIASGIDPTGRRVGPGMNLQESGGAASGSLIHTKDTGDKIPNDPGDTLAQSLDLQPTLPCKGGSASGTVQLGMPLRPSGFYVAEEIKWSIKSSATKIESSSISLTESTPPGRVSTSTIDVTGGKGKRYPKFPGTPRNKGCSCEPVTGVQVGKDCKATGTSVIGNPGK